MGGITLFLVGVQVATGILLLLYYRPSAGEAYESVKFIVTQVEFGWLIRNLHSWSANLLILMAFVHLFSTLFLRSYRKPRELTWVTGVLLLFLMMGFGFSGYLLPWNELAFFATKVGTGISGAVPVVGDFMVRFLRGGDEVTGATLTRFYGIHVAILPAITTVLLGPPVAHPAARHERAAERRAAREGRRADSADAVLSALRPARRDVVVRGAGGAGGARGCSRRGSWASRPTPFAPVPAGIRPEWYFLAMFQALKLLPAHIMGIEGEVLGVLGFGLCALVLLLCRSWTAAPRRAAPASSSPLAASWRWPTCSCSPSMAILPPDRTGAAMRSFIVRVFLAAAADARRELPARATRSPRRFRAARPVIAIRLPRTCRHPRAALPARTCIATAASPAWTATAVMPAPPTRLPPRRRHEVPRQAGRHADRRGMRALP